MGWGAAFLASLRDVEFYAPMFVLRRIKMANEPGDTFEASSAPGAMSTYRVGEVRINGATLTPRTWETTTGGFTVEIVGNPTDALLALPRGTIVEVMLVINGYEGRIAVGQVRTIRGTAPSVTIECLDLINALRSPLDTTADPMFSGVTASTTTTAGAPTGTGTYTVGSTTGFQRETGGFGAFLVTPTVGDPYYRIWNASTATTFTIEDPSDASEMGTADTGASSGNDVEEVAYLYGHPFDILRKVLVSTGAGTNGPWDLLPQDWSIGVQDSYVDTADIEVAKAYVAVASGSYILQIPVTVDGAVEITDPIGWLEDITAPMGIWLAMRQGAITVRAAQSSHATGGVWYATDDLDWGVTFTVTLAEVVAVLDYDAWSPDHAHEYVSTIVQTATTARTISDGRQASLPGGGSLTHDVSATVFSNPVVIETEMAARLFEADVRIPERLVLRLRGLRAAQLCVGDIIVLDLATGTDEIIHCRAGGGFVARSAVVHEMTPDWMARTVDLAVWVYPDRSTSPTGSGEVA